MIQNNLLTLDSLVFALIFTHNQVLEPEDEYHKLARVGQICLGHFIFTFALSAYVYFVDPAYIRLVASALGILAAILAAAQYFPQIYTTLHLQHAGSLSIKMMLMQTPGGFAWAASLAFREGTQWSSWLPYLTAAILQCILLTIAVYFELRNRKTKVVEDVITQPSEASPLLGN